MIPPNFTQGNIPKLDTAQNSIGFFHENDAIGGMESVEQAILFEIPDSPMLSIFQFRHANLNNYSHGGPVMHLGIPMRRLKLPAIVLGKS